MTKYLRTRMSDFLSRKTRQTTMFFSRLNHWYLIINCCQIDVQILNRSKIVKLFSKHFIKQTMWQQEFQKWLKNEWFCHASEIQKTFKMMTCSDGHYRRTWRTSSTEEKYDLFYARKKINSCFRKKWQNAV